MCRRAMSKGETSENSKAGALDDPKPMAGVFPPGDGLVARSIAFLGGKDQVEKVAGPVRMHVRSLLLSPSE